MERTRRKLTPEFAPDRVRDARLGCEPPDFPDTAHGVEHGSPTSLGRRRFHDACELEPIVGAHGRAFVGGDAGPCEPGRFVLIGRRLPYNASALDPMPILVVAARVNRSEPVLHAGSSKRSTAPPSPT